jgi:hypothetical protein
LRRTRYAARQLPSVAGLTAPPPFLFLYVNRTGTNKHAPAGLRDCRAGTAFAAQSSHYCFGAVQRCAGSLPRRISGPNPRAGRDCLA